MTRKIVRNFFLIAFLLVLYSLIPKSSITVVEARPCCEEFDCNGDYTNCMFGATDASCSTLFPDGRGDNPGFVACMAQCHAEEVACANRPCAICSWNPGPNPCGPYGLFCAPWAPGTSAPWNGSSCVSDLDCSSSFCGADGYCYGNMAKQCTSNSNCPTGMECYLPTNTCVQYGTPYKPPSP